MNSCLYECNVMHCRTRPKRHKFNHKVYMWYIDLDELDQLSKKNFLVSRNKRNIFSFYDQDHMEFQGHNIKENVLEYLSKQGVELKNGRIMLLTNLRTFGYVFNPVSFYFCFDEQGQPVCVVPEIGNTFGELKPYFLGKDKFENGKFVSQQKKYFYISPFIDLDVPLDFQLNIPEDRLKIQIDDFDREGKFLYATLTGEKKELNNLNLLWYGIRYPFVTLKIITLIHIHALMLFLKKIPFHPKENNPELQKEVLRAWSKH